MEQIGLWAGFILTMLVFSYVLGDNVLYRLAVYVFVGLAAGYIVVVTWDSVLTPWINGTIRAGGVGNIVFGAIPLALGALLLLKASRRFGRLGGLALPFLIGVGAAVALVGAVSRTLIPLTRSTGNISLNQINSILLLIGVVCTLVYFQYLARRTAGGQIQRGLIVRLLSVVGQGVIVVTLGALYAAAIITSLTIFSERVSYIVAHLARIGGA